MLFRSIFEGKKADFDGFWLLGKATRPTETSDFVAKDNGNRCATKGQIELKSAEFKELPLQLDRASLYAK